MPNSTPEDPALAAGQEQGYHDIERNTHSQIGRVKRLMDRYGTSNDAYLAKMQEAQLGAEADAKLRLDANLAMSQLRSRVHEAKLKMLMDAYKRQQKDARTQMWATALGSGAQVGQGIWGMYSGPSGPGRGEIYTDLSGNQRVSP